MDVPAGIVLLTRSLGNCYKSYSARQLRRVGNENVYAGHKGTLWARFFQTLIHHTYLRILHPLYNSWAFVLQVLWLP